VLGEEKLVLNENEIIMFGTQWRGKFEKVFSSHGNIWPIFCENVKRTFRKNVYFWNTSSSLHSVVCSFHFGDFS